MVTTEATQAIIATAVETAGGIRPAQRLLAGLSPNYHQVRNVARKNAVHYAEKWLFIPDIHVPDQDESALAVVEEFMRDFRPHHVCIMGDLINADSVALFPQGEVECTQADEYMMAEDILDRFRPDVLLEGNHEERFRRPGSISYRLWDLVRPARWFGLKKRGIRWVPYSNRPGDLFKIGKLTVIHGFRTNEYAAKAEAMAFGCVIHAHTHRVQNFQPKHAYEKNTGFNIGCLCRLDLDYQTTGTPRGWTQAFAFGYFFKDGNFSLYTARLIGDEFVIEGRCYHRPVYGKETA